MNKWIPVSERLPEESKMYLISVGGYVVEAGWYINHFRTVIGFAEVKPDAWMELPEPYKEKV